MSRLILVLIVCAVITLIGATLAPSKGKKVKTIKEKENLAIKIGPQRDSVFHRKLIEDEPSARDILNENGAYYEDTSVRNFNGSILGYVTPWNNHGYDVAKIWGPKFKMISPVWLQILRKGNQKYDLGGAHDIDLNWVKDVRKAAGKSIKVRILPRVLFDKFKDTDFGILLTYVDEQQMVADLIVETCKKYKFDGIVLELWSTLSARVEDGKLIGFVSQIGEALRAARMDFVLVIPPNRSDSVELFTQAHFDRLYPVVTAFSLMTYDFSSVQRPGANAPLYWMKNAVEQICPTTTPHYLEKRKKILLGLNMYGMDFTPEGGSPIVAGQFLDLVKHVKGRLLHDEHDQENFFEVKTSSGRHFVFYPTLFSINERIKLAEELGTGLSLWELGQGLDYFYDLF